ncbi:Aldose 1-epimerase [Hypsibius exemplaris]|uniref:Aldose 1-epimerase n=1 Tax=Hypsibius exemplaris TaxID=2072580 RepID=A0A1W0XAI7_HYPEX|nr:Aldose 1-epimerase [Hypsibius exemplaris]
MGCLCCNPNRQPPFQLKTRIFGHAAFSQPVQLYQLTNKHGMELSVISFGARIIGLKVPGLNGQMVDVVRGFKKFEDYQTDEFYFGAIVGRVAGRIHPSTVKIAGKAVHLVPNTQNVHHNGGKNGFDTAIWTVQPIEEDDRNGVSGIKFRYVSPDGSEGYPGELVTEVEYRLTNRNELKIRITAVTEATTLLSIPCHAYFNLGGPKEANIYDHRLTVNAEEFTPLDGDMIPTGEITPVEGTPYDFRRAGRIGDMIGRLPTEGYDHNWCIASGPGGEPVSAAHLYCPSSGIGMEVLTTQPGLTVYTGNFLSKSLIGANGEVMDKHSAVCLETQNYPNAPNVERFPSAVLTPGQTYDHTTLFRFSVRRPQKPPVQ